MIHETKRLILRPWTEDDAEELYRYAKDPKVGPAAGWPTHTSIDDSREIIKNVFSADEMYAVVLKSTDKPVGSIGFLMGSNSNLGTLPADECEIGYWLGVPYWGQGLIPEASMVLLDYAFNKLGMNKVWCAYFEDNNQSKRVQEKCGFKYQYTRKDAPVSLLGETRTELVSSLTREEWERR